MENIEFEKQLQNLKIPQTEPLSHQQLLKITLLNARKSSQIGLLFVLVPCLFLVGILIKYYLGVDFKLFSRLEEVMVSFDRIPYLTWIFPFLLIGLPLISIIINSLSIIHFYWERVRKELVITIKFKLINIAIIVISAAIIAVFLLYAIVEHIHHMPTVG